MPVQVYLQIQTRLSSIKPLVVAQTTPHLTAIYSVEAMHALHVHLQSYVPHEEPLLDQALKYVCYMPAGGRDPSSK